MNTLALGEPAVFVAKACQAQSYLYEIVFGRRHPAQSGESSTTTCEYKRERVFGRYPKHL